MMLSTKQLKRTALMGKPPHHPTPYTKKKPLKRASLPAPLLP